MVLFIWVEVVSAVADTRGGGGRSGTQAPKNFYWSFSFEKWEHKTALISIQEMEPLLIILYNLCRYII